MANQISGSDGSYEPDAVLELFARISGRAAESVAANSDWAESGRRVGQYRVDLDLDEVCVPALLDAGFGVLSEESGLQFPGTDTSSNKIVVVDPLDGSTNASLGLPWFATSLCLVVDGEPAVAMVTNLATGARFSAVREGGATLDGRSISISRRAPLDDAVIATSGLADHHYGWRQFRAMGASALDICSVATGAFDGFVDMSPDAHGVWDYLGSLLVVTESGGVIADAAGRDLVVLDHDARRTPVAATSSRLLDSLLSERSENR